MTRLFLFTDPRGKLPAPEQTRWVQREVDPHLVVQWDAQRDKYVVLDTAAPGGPDAAYVMVVQESDGSFRPFDQRTVDTLRKLRFGHRRAQQELERMERERIRDGEKRRADFAESLAKDFRWFGQQWTPSVGWRDRTDVPDHIKVARREAIRAEAV